jgi:hypothetical protein
MKAFVVEVYDIDCDGHGYSYHYQEGADEYHAEVRFRMNPDNKYYHDFITNTIPLTTFFCRWLSKMDKFDRNYFAEVGYFSKWYPRPGLR